MRSFCILGWLGLLYTIFCIASAYLRISPCGFALVEMTQVGVRRQFDKL